MANGKTRAVAVLALSVLLAVAVAVLAGVGAADPGHGNGHGNGKGEGKGEGKADDHGSLTTTASKHDDAQGDDNDSSGSAQYQYGSAGKQYGHNKVTLCHKGHTISVALPAVKAHLRHGDKPDACHS